MSLQESAALAEERIRKITAELNELFRGKQARIVSNYNGQPVGSSRRPLTGLVVTITSVEVDGAGYVHVFVSGQSVALRPMELEVLP